MATGARVRLIRRGAAQPVGVRWAAPIACARSVQAAAKRQRCLRHRCNQVSSKARKQAPEQHRRGAPAHRARHHLGNHTPHTRPPTLPPPQVLLWGRGAKTGGSEYPLKPHGSSHPHSRGYSIMPHLYARLSSNYIHTYQESRRRMWSVLPRTPRHSPLTIAPIPGVNEFIKAVTYTANYYGEPLQSR